MARPPSYDFERRERQKAKDAKRAAKAEAKREGKAGEASGSPDVNQAQQVVDEMDVAIARDTIQKD